MKNRRPSINLISAKFISIAVFLALSPFVMASSAPSDSNDKKMESIREHMEILGRAHGCDIDVKARLDLYSDWVFKQFSPGENQIIILTTIKLLRYYMTEQKETPETCETIKSTYEKVNWKKAMGE